MKSLQTALLAGTLLAATGIPPAPAFAFEDDMEDLDDLGDDLLDAPKGDVKPKAPAAVPSEEGDFDFGDDPDWDAGPAPVPEVDDFDEDPPEDGGAPEDDFDFGDDPPDDFIQSRPPAGSADFLEEDPPEGGTAVVPAAPATGLGIATQGKAPLADNYPAAIVGKDLDAVVVELPVLVASKPTDVESDYWLVTELRVADRKVGESRHYVSRQTVADMGPTLVWVKSVVPVLERAGKVELRVSQATVDGAEKALFTKTVGYSL